MLACERLRHFVFIVVFMLYQIFIRSHRAEYRRSIVSICGQLRLSAGNGESLSFSFPFVRGEVLPATSSPPHLIVSDMPPGTDCPYPIRMLAFFEMIRPYHVVIRIRGKF